MPQDRLRSPRAGHGRKTTSLSDFEYRVWDQFQLSADDFGVMRLSALTVQNDNEALSQRPSGDIQEALERLIVVGLALTFEHQGRRYLCDPTWQSFQKVEYPRITMHPKPTAPTLLRCDLATRGLFKRHPGGNTKRSPKVSQTSSEDLQVSRARGARETANANANANANGKENIVQSLFAQFWAAYPRHEKRALAEAVFCKLHPDEALLAKLLAALEWQRRQPKWLKDDGQFIPHPTSWLNQRRWEDEPLASSVPIRRSTVPDAAATRAKLSEVG